MESRNADGTFQVRINGAARTFSEPQVAAMTGLKKGPLYEMLGRVTRERSAGKEEGEFFETDREAEKQASTELSSFYQAEGMASSRSAAERAAENRSLLEARPYRRHPPSSQMHLLTTDAHGMALQKAMILVDHAHDDGDLTPVRISHRVDHAGAEGAYRWAQGKIWAQIGVSRATAYPLMTTVHEIGHHIRLHLDPEEVAKVTAVARAAQASQQCRQFGMNTGYWLSDSELFSRVYAQWVLERAGDAEAAQELDSILKGPDFWQQFGIDDWTPIRQAMDSMLKKKGWL